MGKSSGKSKGAKSKKTAQVGSALKASVGRGSQRLNGNSCRGGADGLQKRNTPPHMPRATAPKRTAGHALAGQPNTAARTSSTDNNSAKVCDDAAYDVLRARSRWAKERRAQPRSRSCSSITQSPFVAGNRPRKLLRSPASRSPLPASIRHGDQSRRRSRPQSSTSWRAALSRRRSHLPTHARSIRRGSSTVAPRCQQTPFACCEWQTTAMSPRRRRRRSSRICSLRRASKICDSDHFRIISEFSAMGRIMLRWLFALAAALATTTHPRTPQALEFYLGAVVDLKPPPPCVAPPR